MLHIGTHNSATGEESQGFLSKLVTVFAKTQSKTIKEQYEAGCRIFDIRVKYINNRLVCAHGLWHTKRDAEDILNEINSFKGKKRVMLIYEGTSKYKEAFTSLYDYFREKFNNTDFCEVAIKYGSKSKGLKIVYDYIKCDYKGIKVTQGFLPLNGKTWHTLMPIPWLWKKIYNDNPQFGTKDYLIVDFL